MNFRNLGKNFGFVFRLLLSVAALIWILTTISLDDITEILLSSNLYLIGLGIFLYILGDLLSAKKLEILANENKLKFLGVLRIYYIGKLFNTFLPSTIGGDAIKSKKLHSILNSSNGYSSVFMERFTGLIAVLFIAIISSTIFASEIPDHIRFMILFGFLPALTLLSLAVWSKTLEHKIVEPIITSGFLTSYRISNKIEKFYKSLQDYRNQKKIVAESFMLSLVFHIVLIGLNISFAYAIGINISPIYFFIVIPVAAIILFLPISVGGFGAREIIYISLLTQAGVTPAKSASLAFLVNSMVILAGFIGVTAYITETD